MRCYAKVATAGSKAALRRIDTTHNCTPENRAANLHQISTN